MIETMSLSFFLGFAGATQTDMVSSPTELINQQRRHTKLVNNKRIIVISAVKGKSRVPSSGTYVWCECMPQTRRFMRKLALTEIRRMRTPGGGAGVERGNEIGLYKPGRMNHERRREMLTDRRTLDMFQKLKGTCSGWSLQAKGGQAMMERCQETHFAKGLGK